MKRFGSSRPTACPVQCGCGHLMACSRGGGPSARAACDGVATISANSEPIPPRRPAVAH
jgi:hypothetical protein